jgi:O-antigen/teichoic acid export membrane protein
MGELPRRTSGRYALLNAAILTAGATGAVIGLAFAVIAPLLSPNLSALDDPPTAAISFAAGAGLTALTYVLDQALVGLLRGGLQLFRNVIFAAAKLVALLALATLLAAPGAAWIYTAWGAGIALSLIVLFRVYGHDRRGSLRPDFATLGTMRRAAASHAAVNLALETADLAMPIIVLSLLSPAQNGGFYLAWLVVGFMVMIPFSLSSVAYAIGSGAGGRGRIEERFRFTFVVSIGLGVIANLILIPAAGPILTVFGPGYAETATSALQILALGVFPLTVKTHYVAIHRVRRTLGRALPIAWAGTALELGGGALGAALGGISGVAWGWLAGLLIEAVVMGRDVWQIFPPRRRPPARPAANPT